MQNFVLKFSGLEGPIEGDEYDGKITKGVFIHQPHFAHLSTKGSKYVYQQGDVSQESGTIALDPEDDAHDSVIQTAFDDKKGNVETVEIYHVKRNDEGKIVPTYKVELGKNSLKEGELSYKVIKFIFFDKAPGDKEIKEGGINLETKKKA